MNSASPNPMALGERHFLVTGVGSGIGQATASLFAALGARVSLVDRDEPAMQRTLAALPGQGHAAFAFDLADIANVDDLVKRIVDASGRLHGLVHAAGIQSAMPAKDIGVDTWRGILAVNTESALALARNMARQRVHAGGDGAVIFVSSVMALAGGAGSVAYSMSKAALHGMARSLALELAPRGVRVNCIAPGFVRTPMFDRQARHWDDAQRAAVEAMHPLGFGQPEDIAHAAAFLAAPSGRWITGTVLVVDGGYLAR